MKLLSTFAFVTLTALSLGGAAQAQNFGARLAQAYTAAGYENVTVTHAHGSWTVTGTRAGVTESFAIDHKSGKAKPTDVNGKGRHHGADDGAGHDVGDDHGGHGADDGAGHDVGDDHGGHGADDGADHDAGDDHGGHGGDDGADHDAGDDHGHSGSDD